MKKLTVIQGHIMRGASVGTFHWKNGDLELINRKVITPLFIVEPEFQALRFSKGNKTDFVSLYNTIVSEDVFDA